MAVTYAMAAACSDFKHSELNLPNMLDCLSADVYRLSYVLTQWIDQKIGS